MVPTHLGSIMSNSAFRFGFYNVKDRNCTDKGPSVQWNTHKSWYSEIHQRLYLQEFLWGPPAPGRFFQLWSSYRGTYGTDDCRQKSLRAWGKKKESETASFLIWLKWGELCPKFCGEWGLVPSVGLLASFPFFSSSASLTHNTCYVQTS